MLVNCYYICAFTQKYGMLTLFVGIRVAYVLREMLIHFYSGKFQALDMSNF